MESIVVICAVIATVTFVVKTVVGWIKSAQYEKRRSIERASWEAEKAARHETRMEERLKRLEMYNFGNDDD